MKQAILISKLRWLLFKNSLRNKNNIIEAVAGGIAFFFIALLDLGLSFGMGIIAYTTYDHQVFVPLTSLMLLGILLIWQFVPIFTASFSSDLGISRFRIYPLSARSLFLLDIFIGTFDPISILAIVAILGIFTGVFAKDPRQAPIAALALLMFVGFNVGLSRFIQRLFASFFASRRRKEVVALVIFLLLFAPQIIMMSRSRTNLRQHQTASRRVTGRKQPPLPEARTQEIESAARTVWWAPPGLAAATIGRSSSGYSGTFFSLSLMLLFLAAVFGLEFRHLTLDYLGRPGLLSSIFTRLSARSMAHTTSLAEHPKALGTVSVTQAEPTETTLWSRILEHFSPAAGAVFEKDLRYYYRSPRAILIFMAPVLGSVIFLLPGTPLAVSGIASQYRLAAIYLYAFMLGSQILNNSFAFDWHGAKLYFVSPASGSSILAGKNLAGLTCAVVQLSLITVAYNILSGPMNPNEFFYAVMVCGIVLPINLTVGNYLSMLYPRGIDFAKVYGKSYSGVSAFISFAIIPFVLMIVAVGPVLGWLLNSKAIPYVVLLVEAGVSIAIYFPLRSRAGGLLERRAEPFLESLFKTR